MNWIHLERIEALEDIKALSNEKEVIIFKHSTRCFISKMVKTKFEKKAILAENDGVVYYYLDLIKYRAISNEIATAFNVAHQSPQVIVFKDGKAIKNASHYDIVTDIEL